MTASLDSTDWRPDFYPAFGVIAIGLAHLIFPAAFEGISRMGWPDDPRRHVYINGCIETTIGVLLTTRQTRRPWAGIVAAIYLIYLSANVIRTQRA